MNEPPDIREFNIDHQSWFASVSGDFNPIHVDPVAARRSIAGEIIVHGMHTLLWALDRHLAHEDASIVALDASFLQPVLLHQELGLLRETDGDVRRLSVRSGAETLLLIRITLSPASLHSTLDPAPMLWTTDHTPRERYFEDLRDAAGDIRVWGDRAPLADAFPHAVEKLGLLRVAGLAALSRLVGMECPGLHSLLSSLTLNFDDRSETRIEYRVTRARSKRAPLVISVAGSGFDGTVSALIRPVPVVQALLADIHSTVAPREFSVQRALVVGGSRGLGEITAKIIAAGGGGVTLTYNTGESDARRVANEIFSAGGECEVIELDVLDPAAALDKLRRGDKAFGHLYYFPTPRIARRKAGLSETQPLELFHSYYVEAFSRMCLAIVGDELLRVFYPSTIYINQPVENLNEYIAAKLAGEAKCRHLHLLHPRIAVVAGRLPKLNTDQNLSFLGKPADDPVPHMIRVVRQMNALEK